MKGFKERYEVECLPFSGVHASGNVVEGHELRIEVLCGSEWKECQIADLIARLLNEAQERDR